MGQMVGRLTRSATPGERKFYGQIATLVKDDPGAFCYYEPWLRDLVPDFLLLSPRRGVLVVEIKDYLPEHLVAAPRSGPWQKFVSVADGSLKVQKGTINMSNPFDKLLKYFRAVMDCINYAVLPPGLDVNVAQLAVFSNIARDSPTGQSIQEIIPLKIHAAFQETLASRAAFRECLASVAPSRAPIPPEWFEVVRANIIPTARLPCPEQKKIADYVGPEDRVKMLDAEQEQLAGELGSGHRLFFGVAGSGKTVLLAARARFLAKKFPRWRILVLCYNRLLENYLQQVIDPQDLQADVTVATFHKWAGDTIWGARGDIAARYKTALDHANANPEKKEQFFNQQVPALLEEVIEKALGNENVEVETLSIDDELGNERNVATTGSTQNKSNINYQGEEEDRIPISRPWWQYDAILVDEAQDFAAEWFRPLVRCLNPKTDSLMIACDGLQAIYDRKKFHWSDVGINARGRVRKFTKSYRNPPEVGEVAIEILPPELAGRIGQSDEFLPTLEFAGNPGKVELYVAKTREEEYDWMAKIIVGEFAKNGENSKDQLEELSVLILLKRNLSKGRGDRTILEVLKRNSINWEFMEDSIKAGLNVHIGTLKGTKGLEADIVIIPEIDTFRNSDDQQLLYVGATRARSKLFLSAVRSTPLVQHLREIIGSS